MNTPWSRAGYGDGGHSGNRTLRSAGETESQRRKTMGGSVAISYPFGAVPETALARTNAVAPDRTDCGTYVLRRGDRESRRFAVCHLHLDGLHLAPDVSLVPHTSYDEEVCSVCTGLKIPGL